jgi:deoxyadenosine/deoxycytidine kinase
MPIITVDGNIGCCKTSILNYFHRHFKTAVDLEPVENWTQHLNKLYMNEKESSYTFQIKVWMDRCWIQEKSENVLIMMERSPHFIKNVFIQKAFEDSTITKDEYDLLHNLHARTDQLWKPHAYIYLNSDPDMCLQRVNKRGRLCEKQLKHEYIQRIHDLHGENVQELLRHNINVIIVDIENKSIAEICQEIISHKVFQNVIANIDNRMVYNNV